MAGHRDTLCDTQPVVGLSDSDEIFAIELPAAYTSDLVTAVIVNIDTSASLRSVLRRNKTISHIQVQRFHSSCKVLNNNIEWVAR